MDEHKTREQLVDELAELRRRVAELEAPETERKQAEEALRESEEKYRSLVEDSTDGIAIVQGREIKFVNQTLLNMFGYQSEDEMVGHTFTDFVSPSHRSLMAERGYDREKGEHIPSRYEFKALRKDNAEFDAEISVSTIVYQESTARQGIVRDITARKQAEEALQASEELLSNIIDSMSDGILVGHLTCTSPFLDYGASRSSHRVVSVGP